jgi:light-regulated signal transduction histidine kinase (bacteriophytochrome)
VKSVICKFGAHDYCLQPIRTPGAVQAFGVLIAVDEQEDALVVRQVSEASCLCLPVSHAQMSLPRCPN